MCVYFTIVSKKYDEVCVNGYVNISEIDDEKPLNFFNRYDCGVNKYVPQNPYTDDEDI